MKDYYGNGVTRLKKKGCFFDIEDTMKNKYRDCA